MSTADRSAAPILQVTAPLRQTKLADQLYEQILEQIVSGRLSENDRLPSEAELSRMFGVSRPVVREALTQLRSDGLVVSRQGSGTYVRRRPPRDFMRLAPIGSVAELLRCYEVRIALESEAAALAAERRTPAHLDAIRQALDQLASAVESGAVGTEADLRFHASVAAASGNPWFETLMHGPSRHIENAIKLARTLSLLKDSERLARVQREHVAVFEAIERGDAEAACKAMRRHLDNSRTRILNEQAEP